MRKKILQTSAFLLVALFIVSGCLPKKPPKNAITEIEFFPVQLTTENLEKYPFLTPLKKEISENRERFEEHRIGNLLREDKEFTSPDISLALVEMNNEI